MAKFGFWPGSRRGQITAHTFAIVPVVVTSFAQMEGRRSTTDERL